MAQAWCEADARDGRVLRRTRMLRAMVYSKPRQRASHVGGRERKAEALEAVGAKLERGERVTPLGRDRCCKETGRDSLGLFVLYLHVHRLHIRGRARWTAVAHCTVGKQRLPVVSVCFMRDVGVGYGISHEQCSGRGCR